MSCAMIYWGRNYERFLSIFSKFGAVVDIRHLNGKRIGHASEIYATNSLFKMGSNTD